MEHAGLFACLRPPQPLTSKDSASGAIAAKKQGRAMLRQSTRTNPKKDYEWGALLPASRPFQ